MSKLVVLLAVYAAAVSTLLLVEHLERRSGSDKVEERDTFLDPDSSTDVEVRKVMAEVRDLMAAEAKATVESIDWQLSRIEELRASMEDGLVTAQRTATEAGQTGYSKLEALQQDLEKVRGMGAALSQVREEVAGLAARVKEVEERPAQVIREVAKGGPATPVVPQGTEPDRPTLPQAARKDPEVVRGEIARARQDIQSKELNVVFKAIQTIQEHRVLEAVPRLIEILAAFPEEFGRTGAAAALGKMKVADAVPALAEALLDKSAMVSQQANLSIRQITGYDTQMSPTARLRERRTIRNKVKEWWRDHEEEVREQLGQPAKAAVEDG